MLCEYEAWVDAENENPEQMMMLRMLCCGRAGSRYEILLAQSSVNPTICTTSSGFSLVLHYYHGCLGMFEVEAERCMCFSLFPKH